LGQLGSDLAVLLPEATALGHGELNIADVRAAERVFKEVQPELVFNCAAYNGVDRAESDYAITFAANALAPSILAALCARHQARLVHFSTNFVFAGDAKRPYTERSRPRPRSSYGRTKLYGERHVLRALPDALVIRSSGLYGVRGSAVKGGSFPERIIARARAGGPVRVVGDQRLNPTFTGHLAGAALAFASQGLTGVVHAVAEGCCTYAELAREALRLAGLSVPVDEIRTAELGAPAARPLNGCLRSLRVEPLPPWREGLAEWWRGQGA
jgi:dTDP-4-dehydrorhamnose reductase